MSERDIFASHPATDKSEIKYLIRRINNDAHHLALHNEQLQTHGELATAQRILIARMKRLDYSAGQRGSA